MQAVREHQKAYVLFGFSASYFQLLRWGSELDVPRERVEGVGKGVIKMMERVQVVQGEKWGREWGLLKIALTDMGLRFTILFSSKEEFREPIEHLMGFLTKRE